MFNAIFRYFFPAPSVASITATFTRQAEALRDLAEAEANKANVCCDKIMDLQAARDAADAECHRAHTVAERIEKLTSV